MKPGPDAGPPSGTTVLEMNAAIEEEGRGEGRQRRESVEGTEALFAVIFKIEWFLGYDRWSTKSTTYQTKIVGSASRHTR